MLYQWQRRWVFLVTGVLGITIAAPEAIWDWTDGAVSGALLMLIVGLVLLAASGVGIMLLNRDGKVFVGARIDNTDDAWQMPQGGIDEHEHKDPWVTALRELEEETGILPHLVEKVSECPERLKYDLPEEIRGRLWGGRWVGQDQDWYLARFKGDDSDVNIASAKRFGMQAFHFTGDTKALRKELIRLGLPLAAK